MLTALRVKRTRKLTGQGQHHRERVLGAWLSVHRRASGENPAAFAQSRAEILTVIICVTGAGEMNPPQSVEPHRLLSIRLAEGYVCFGQQRVGPAAGKIQRLDLGRIQEPMPTYTVAEQSRRC